VSEAEPIYRLVETVLRPALGFWFDWRFEGTENVQRTGPILVAGNHVSHIDPLAHGYFLNRTGRRARYLAKSELWRNLFLRQILDGTRQIPVDRGSGRSAPVDAALRGLQAGRVVVVYPEATTTKNEDKTPMQGKTGIARIALRSGLPVLPLAVWGTQHILQRGESGLTHHRPIWVTAGQPIDVGEHAGSDEEPALLRTVTERVMGELTRMVKEMREGYPAAWG
jgi:1-acyl-sn-glycerol-3-phosphate acyltransferase